MNDKMFPLTSTSALSPSPKPGADASITPTQISDLVDQFYARVFSHPRLGPIFEEHIADGQTQHLDKMKSFWRSVLLKTGEYKGRPVPVHLKIGGITTVDFQEWLKLFATTSKEIFAPEVAVTVEQAAQRIATSLWLSRTSDPGISPPDWIEDTAPALTVLSNGDSI